MVQTQDVLYRFLKREKVDMKIVANDINKDMECLERIRYLYDKQSKASQKIADYILANYQKVIYMTVLQLADACGVSEASIVRFCKNIAYSGFNEMKINLAAESDQGGQVIMGDVAPTDDEQMILEKVFAHEVLALQTTLRAVNREDFARAVNRIAFANRIEFFACGNTKAIAQDASYRFLRIGIDVRVGIDKMDSLIHASMLGPGDVAIGISHSGSTKATIQMLERAREKGAVTVCITGMQQTPITKTSDISFVTQAKETECSNVAMTSRIAQLALIDALVVAVAFKRFEYAKQCIHQTDKLAAEDKV